MRLNKHFSVKPKLSQSVLACLGVVSAAVAAFCGVSFCHAKHKLHQNRENAPDCKSSLLPSFLYGVLSREVWLNLIPVTQYLLLHMAQAKVGLPAETQH